MRRGNRASLVNGVLLIIAGFAYFIFRSNPAVQAWFDQYWAWPMLFVALGGLLLLLGFVLGEPGMCVPAAIVIGLGGIFYYQLQTDNWTSWIYLWTLIPGFVGVGIVLASLFDRHRHSARAGFDLILISGVLYLVFASIFGGMDFLGPYGPAILMITFGIYVLIRGAVSSHRKKQLE